MLIVLAVIAAAAFMYMRSRGGAPGPPGRGGSGPALRGRRGAARATRHDPMAEAVERHAQATDPHEAAEAELRLQAQANRVASDLHAQQASTLESQAGGRGLTARSPGTDAYGQPVDSGPAPAYGSQEPVYEDETGRPVYEDGTPVDQDARGAVPERDGGAAYYDEQGRPVYPEDRPRY